MRKAKMFGPLLLAANVMFTGCAPDSESTDHWSHASASILDAAISSDGHFVAVSTLDDGVLYWDLETQQVIYKWSHNSAQESAPKPVIRKIAFSPQGLWVITADRRSYSVWDTASGRPLTARSVSANISDVAISLSAGSILVGLEDGRAMYVDQRTGRGLNVLAHQGKSVTAVALSADGDFAVTGGGDGRVMVWETTKGDEIAAFQHQGQVIQVALDQQGERVFSSDNRGGAFIWHAKTGEVITRLALKRGQYGVTAARFSPDAARLLTGHPRRVVILWDSNNGRKIQNFEIVQREEWFRDAAAVHAVTFDATGQSVLGEASNGLGQRWAITSSP